VRRRGHSPHDAQDLTQGFFAQLLETDYLAQVDRQKGKFRSFLLAALNHFLLDTRKRENAAKRGSGQTPLSLDEATAEDRYALESQDEMSPERIYERRWALTVLDHVLSRLENEFAAARKSEQFEQLRPFLLGGTESQPYSKVAERLGMDEGAVRTAVHRMRRRYGELLQEEIAHTVASPDEIEGELTYLINALGS
jgi:RNA polymerase sigma-70 factor (ECF subfamily)